MAARSASAVIALGDRPARVGRPLTLSPPSKADGNAEGRFRKRPFDCTTHGLAGPVARLLSIEFDPGGHVSSVGLGRTVIAWVALTSGHRCVATSARSSHSMRAFFAANDGI